MPKLPVIEGTTLAAIPSSEPNRDLNAQDALSVLKDYLNIGDPAIQQAIADLIAALSRLPI